MNQAVDTAESSDSESEEISNANQGHTVDLDIMDDVMDDNSMVTNKSDDADGGNMGFVRHLDTARVNLAWDALGVESAATTGDVGNSAVETAGSSKHKNVRKVEDGIDNELYVKEWYEDILFPQDVPQGESRYQGEGGGVVWKGVPWNQLLVVYYDGRSLRIAAYIGTDHFTHVPANWTVHLRMSTHVVDDENKRIPECLGLDLVYLFRKPHTNDEPRIDQGSQDCYNGNAFMKYVRSRPANSQGEVAARFRIRLEHIFSPAVPPYGYDSYTSTGMVGLENLGATCYLNALLQMLFHVNKFRRAVYQLPFENEELSGSTTLALQNVFKELQISTKEVTTKELTRAFGWTSAEAFMQQDVQEMMRVLIDKLEEKMKGTVVEDTTKRLFAGSVRSYIRCVNVDYESKRTEDFYDIQLDVKDCADIYESFRRYTTVETLDGENQYEAGAHGKQDARKGVIFEKFPPVLTVHLKRFDFDMNTFGFTKIHDRLPFPERLELNDFLADDLPPEAYAVSNTYLLHSVLVHQGDVGGGHYYAYIRPSTEAFDYSGSGGNPTAGGAEEGNTAAEELPTQFEAAQKKRMHHWYKYNDEVVLGVEPREAIQHCYGRRKNEGLRNMSSAYMLVYIRESEAPEIMRPVGKEDIPAALIERLDTERTAKLAERKRMERDNTFREVAYVTRSDLMKFTEYSRTQDFVCDKKMHPLLVSEGVLKLGILLLIADELEVSPLDLRLWELDKPKGSASLRVVDDYLLGDLEYACKDERLYAQVFENQRVSAEDRLLFDREFTHMQQRAQDMTWTVTEALMKIPELYYEEADLPLAGLGIGMGKRQLQDLKAADPKLFAAGDELFTSLTNNMLALLKQFGEDKPDDSLLLFCKVYDPFNSLPCLNVDAVPADEIDDKEEEEASGERAEGSLKDAPAVGDDVDGAEEALPMAADGERNGDHDDDMAVESNKRHSYGKNVKKVTSRKKLTKKQHATGAPTTTEYIPTKFLGEVLVAKNKPMSAVHAAIRTAFDQYVAPGLRPSQWDNYQNYRLYLGVSPLKLFHHASDSILETGRVVTDGVLVYVDLPPALFGDAELCVPYDLTDAPSWLRYRAQRKQLICRPYSERDVRLLTRRFELYAAQLRRDAASAAAAAVAAAVGAEGVDMNTDPVCEATSTLSVSSTPRDGSGTNGVVAEEEEEEENGGGVAGAEMPATPDKKITTAVTSGAAAGLINIPPRKRLRTSSIGSVGALVDGAGGVPAAAAALGLRSPRSPYTPSTAAAVAASMGLEGVTTHASDVEGRRDGGGEGTQAAAASSTAYPSLGHPFHIDVPLYIKVEKLFKHIADVIMVDVQHLALYMVVADATNPETVLPLAFAFESQSTINEIILSRELANKPSTRYGFFYRILPYRLASANCSDLRKVNRHVDFIVADERLRHWRRMYLQYVYDQQMLATAAVDTGDMAEEKGKEIPAFLPPHLADGSKKAEAERKELIDPSGTAAQYNKNKSSAVVAMKNYETMYGVDIQWPSIDKISEYDALELNTVTCECPRTCLFRDVSTILRDAIGIPFNIGALIEAATKTYASSVAALREEDGDDKGKGKLAIRKPMAQQKETQEVSLPVGQASDLLLSLDPLTQAAMTAAGLPEQSPEVRAGQLKEFCELPYAVCSDRLFSDASSCLGLGPPFPLLVTNVRNRIAMDMIGCQRNAAEMVQCWPEVDEKSMHLWRLTVQHVSFDDMLFMYGAHPTIKSMVVSVFNFSLTGNFVSICEPHWFSGPFLTYVREDDDYYTLAARLGRVTGDADWSNYRLAVTRAAAGSKLLVPHYIPRPTPVTTATTGIAGKESTQPPPGAGAGAIAEINQNATAEEEAVVGPMPLPPPSAAASSNTGSNNGKGQVWALFAKHYELFVNCNYQDAKKQNKDLMPLLGIQRSAADVGAYDNNASGDMFKMFGAGGGGIKIV